VDIAIYYSILLQYITIIQHSVTVCYVYYSVPQCVAVYYNNYIAAYITVYYNMLLCDKFIYYSISGCITVYYIEL